MNTLLKRSISGISLVTLVVTSLLLGSVPALLMMMFVVFVSILELRKMFKIKDPGLTIVVLVLGMTLMVLFHLILVDRVKANIITGFAILSITTLTLYFLFSSNTRFKDISLMALSMFWIAGSSAFLLATGWLYSEIAYKPALPLILLSLIWINDAGAYLVGSFFGKRQFAPAISPGKTWEGFISGVLFTALSGWIVYLITDSFSLLFWIISAVLVSLSAVAGDLFESKLKREAEVKDSGHIIPGHGGMLDRFDSLFFSAPVFYAVILLWNLL